MRLLAVALLAAPASAQSAVAPATPAAEAVAAAARAAGLEGQVLVAEGGRVTLDLGFGHVTPARDAPDVIRLNGGFRPSMRWRWASVTKQVVAVLAMQEVERGRLSLDAPLASVLPPFRGPTGRTVTIRQLLEHTSGLPDPNDDPATYTPGFRGSYDPATGICAGPPRDAPGASFRYNNCDYHLLGAVLERVTGQPLDRLVAERIARPAGARGIAFVRARTPRVPGFHEGEAETALDLPAYAAAGALSGTARDLWRFDQALLDGRYLKPATRETMWTADPKLGFAAFGQWVFTAPVGACRAPVRIVERRGAIGGIGVRNVIVPERNLVLIAFTNRGDTGFGEIWQGRGLTHELLGAAVCGGGR